MAENIDHTDRSILRLLQKDATLSLEQIAEGVSISVNTCWRRIRRMEADGIVTGRVALVDQDRLGLGLTVFVSIQTDDHSEVWVRKFTRALEKIPEVTEFYRLAGEVDYLLKVIVPDIAAYDRVYKSLIRSVEIKNVTASFSMEKIKHTTAVPL